MVMLHMMRSMFDLCGRASSTTASRSFASAAAVTRFLTSTAPSATQSWRATPCRPRCRRGASRPCARRVGRTFARRPPRRSRAAPSAKGTGTVAFINPAAGFLRLPSEDACQGGRAPRDGTPNKKGPRPARAFQTLTPHRLSAASLPPRRWPHRPARRGRPPSCPWPADRPLPPPRSGWRCRGLP